MPGRGVVAVKAWWQGSVQPDPCAATTPVKFYYTRCGRHVTGEVDGSKFTQGTEVTSVVELELNPEDEEWPSTVLSRAVMWSNFCFKMF